MVLARNFFCYKYAVWVLIFMPGIVKNGVGGKLASSHERLRVSVVKGGLVYNTVVNQDYWVCECVSSLTQLCCVQVFLFIGSSIVTKGKGKRREKLMHIYV